LLQRAKATLCDKYGLVLDKPVTLELFKHQQDFAVRTFGSPGGDGFLGVCFGDVITANSPKLERRSNWEATLWHEFCHVVTLNLTNNKMPRWLSEGISVYEERACNPTWGQHMNPHYRKMILGGELTPISRLSSAFLSPPTPMHLQFAYYESSLVVEFLVDRYGLEAVKAILSDLGKGEEINHVIAKHTMAMDELEKAFETFARQRAESLAEKVDWDQPEHLEAGADIDTVTQWLQTHPHSFWALTAQAKYLISQQQWQQAKEPLKTLIDLYPDYIGQDNAYSLLARIYRELNETDEEYQILSEWASRSADAAEAYARLMEIEIEQQAWDKVLQNGEQFLAVYPLRGQIYQDMASAGEALEKTDQAIDAYQRALMLDPADPAEIHYRLAKLYQNTDTALAKRHVLDALADAPRYREAHQLLLQLHATGSMQEEIQ
jgi:tetratricopeptide (TPR) repeat protein